MSSENKQQGNVVDFVKKEGAKTEMPEFFKVAVLVGVSAFMSYLCKELDQFIKTRV